MLALLRPAPRPVHPHRSRAATRSALSTLRRAPALLALLALPLLAADAEARGRLLPFAPPDAEGPFAVGHATFEAVDAARGRTLPVDVWYPVDPEDHEGPVTEYEVLGFGAPSERARDGAPLSEAARFGLVVFSHGNGGIGFQSYFLTEVLASHGFVVVAPDHVGNTLGDILDGTSVPTEEAAVARLGDVPFLVTHMLERSRTPGDRFHRRLARREIGVTGHSFGGFTALGVAAGFGDVAGDFIPLPDGFEPLPPDRRVRAIVPIAPVSSAYSDAELARIRVPTTIVGGTLDDTTPVVPESARAFERIRRNVVRADLAGAVHFSFTNSCDLIQAFVDGGIPLEVVVGLVGDDFVEPCGTEVLAIEEAHRLTTLYTVAHFRRYLQGDARYGFYLSEPYARAIEPDVTAWVKHFFPPFLYLLLLLFGA